MKKRAPGLLLALAAALSLAACGNVSARPAGAGSAPPPESSQAQHAPAAGGQPLRLTLEGDEGTQEITATLMDTPAAEEFALHLPFTIEMHEHPGPTLGIFHHHDGSSINAGIEVLAKLDEGGAEAVASYADLVTVTFALEEAEQSPSAAS